MQAKRKVLVVGDSQTVRDRVGAMLGGAGFGVARASQFELPFAMAREQPDLVLVDVGMRSSDDLAKMVADDESDCPIVLLAEQPEAELRQLADRCRAAGCISMPTGPDELIKRVEAFLERTLQPPSTDPTDLIAFARKATRQEFVAACPFSFLVTTATLLAPPRDHPRTVGLLEEADTLGVYDAPAPGATGPRATALPVRKVTASLPDRITVGRTRENDVVIRHLHVSKLHAYFRTRAEGVDLVDAGSRNGTWVSGQLLTANGPASPVLASGDEVRFGELACTFLSSASCWDILRVNVK
jgi:DNA-binding response OmpR family regulator